MFVRTKVMERLLEEQRVHFEARLADRERLVQLSVEQIEYLRMQVGKPTMTVSSAANGTPLVPGLLGTEITNLWVSEEEEGLDAMRAAGVLSELEHAEALAQLRNRDHIIE